MFSKQFDEEYLVSQIRLLLYRQLAGGEHSSPEAKFQFGGKEYRIASDRSHILGQLLSIYQTAIQKNKELAQAQGALTELNERMERQLHMLDQAQ